MIFLCFFFSGASSLVYGLVWLRVLALIFGHTVSATTAVLAAILAGLGLGGVLLGRIAEGGPWETRVRRPGSLEGIYIRWRWQTRP